LLRRAGHGTGHEGQELLRRGLTAGYQSREVRSTGESSDGIQSRIASCGIRYGLVERAGAACVRKSRLDAAPERVLTFIPANCIGNAGQRGCVSLLGAGGQTDIVIRVHPADGRRCVSDWEILSAL